MDLFHFSFFLSLLNPFFPNFWSLSLSRDFNTLEHTRIHCLLYYIYGGRVVYSFVIQAKFHTRKELKKGGKNPLNAFYIKFFFFLPFPFALLFFRAFCSLPQPVFFLSSLCIADIFFCAHRNRCTTIEYNIEKRQRCIIVYGNVSADYNILIMFFFAKTLDSIAWPWWFWC